MDKHLISSNFHGSQASIIISHFSKTYHVELPSSLILPELLNNILNNVSQKSLSPKGKHQDLSLKAIKKNLNWGMKNLLALSFGKKPTSQVRESASSPGFAIAELFLLACIQFKITTFIQYNTILCLWYTKAFHHLHVISCTPKEELQINCIDYFLQTQYCVSADLKKNTNEFANHSVSHMRLKN